MALTSHRPGITDVISRRRKKKNLSPIKPVDIRPFGGPQDGRRGPQDTYTTPSLGQPGLGLNRGPEHRGAKMSGRPASVEDIAAQKIRREARRALGVADIRQASKEQIKALRRKGLLPGTRAKQPATGERGESIRAGWGKGPASAVEQAVIKRQAKGVKMTSVRPGEKRRKKNADGSINVGRR